MSDVENENIDFIRGFSSGEYSFKHPQLGKVEVSISENPDLYLQYSIGVNGYIEIINEELKRIRTVNKSSSGINSQSAIEGLGSELIGLVADNLREMREGEIIELLAIS